MEIKSVTKIDILSKKCFVLASKSGDDKEKPEVLMTNVLGTDVFLNAVTLFFNSHMKPFIAHTVLYSQDISRL